MLFLLTDRLGRVREMFIVNDLGGGLPRLKAASAAAAYKKKRYTKVVV